MNLHTTTDERQGEFVHHGKVSKVDRYKWTLKDKDKPGIYMLIPKHELNIDPSYQRRIGERKLLRMAQNWSYISCGAIIVADRDGEFFVIDGQHRMDAANRRQDIKELPCIVFETTSAQEEARGFLDANTERRAVTGHEKFRALLVIKDPAALMVNKLCMDSGREIGEAKGRVGVVSCVSCLLHHAREAQSTLQNVWPILVRLTASVPLQKVLVDGLMYIENRMLNGESLTMRKWQDRLIRTGATELVKGANKALGFYAKPSHRAVAIGMIQAINHGCRNRLIIRGMEKEEAV